MEHYRVSLKSTSGPVWPSDHLVIRDYVLNYVQNNCLY